MVALALAVAWSPSRALADGDPASDVLVSQSMFLPQDSHASAAQQARLQGLLDAARRRGISLRVALIASRSDLGSIGALWRRPQTYADFLGRELSLIYRGTVLVAMPDGFGVYRAHGSPVAQRTALARVSPPAPGTLPQATATAIGRLSGVSAAASAPVRRAAPASGGGQPVAFWIVLLGGAAIIAGAWTASLRQRPGTVLRRGVR